MHTELTRALPYEYFGPLDIRVPITTPPTHSATQACKYTFFHTYFYIYLKFPCTHAYEIHIHNTQSCVLHKNKIANNLWKRYSAVVCRYKTEALCRVYKFAYARSMHVCGKIGEEWKGGAAGRTVVQRCALLSVGLEL